MYVGHRIADSVRSVVAYWSATPMQSLFVEKGTLTPQEFVDAGDQLTFKFPTWHWCPAEGKRTVSWLPPEKQYLLTRSIPCKNRVRDLDETLENNVQYDTEGGWFIPGSDDDAEGEEPPTELLTKLPFSDTEEESVAFRGSDDFPREEKAFDGGRRGGSHRTAEGAETSDNDVIPNMADFEDVDSLLLQEEDPANASKSYFVRNAPDADIVPTRTYDLSVTYDKYYQTPRLWLFGYDENGIPLPPNLIFEDILTDYASKTVTVDPHPCTGLPTASIHPCRHADVMKKVVANWKLQGLEPRHDLALFVLLKFVSSVIPTMDYDFTMDIDMMLSAHEK